MNETFQETSQQGTWDVLFDDHFLRTRQRSSQLAQKWTIFNFIRTDNENYKKIVIEKEGESIGILRSELPSEEVRYVLINMAIGYIVKKQYSILILWVPQIVTSENHVSLQHCYKIQKKCKAQVLWCIDTRSYLSRSMLESKIYREGLTHEILLRVIIKQRNNSLQRSKSECTEESKSQSNILSPCEFSNDQKCDTVDELFLHRLSLTRSQSNLVTQKNRLPQIFYIEKNSSLSVLKDRLCKRFGLSEIQIARVSEIVQYPRQFNTSQEDILTEDKKSLDQLGLEYGSLIAIEGLRINENQQDMTNSKTHVNNGDAINFDDIFLLKVVGRGKTASVHQALYRKNLMVAVKEFNFYNLTKKIESNFNQEVDTLKSLSHPNIVSFIGTHRDEESKKLWIILEWLPGGCLKSILNNKLITIDYKKILQMSLDIAEGMEYLHNHKIIHRDLKSHNLLLGENYQIKVADFGTAKHLGKMTKAFTEIGTFGYVAPEVIDSPSDGYALPADVFSYGVILWEIYTRKNPFKDLSISNYSQMIRGGFRPPIPPDCPTEFVKLINKCWETDPLGRPLFLDIVEILREIISQEVILGGFF